MMEKLSPGNSLKEIKTEKVLAQLKRVARWTPRIYFGTDIRRELAGEEYFKLPPALSRKLTTILNQTLTCGGEVIVMDFPFPVGENTNRVQVVTRDYYLRQVNAALPFPRAFEKGYFSVRLANPEHPNVEGALTLAILKNAKPTYTIRWDDEEARSRRFVVLTKQEGNWQLLLDFNLLGKACWRVVPKVFV